MVIAHRGASGRGLAPENTLPAFDLAFDLGAHACELDIRMTRDGHLVVIHDEDTHRLTGGLHSREVENTPLSALRSFDVGRWKHRTYAGTGIPLLREVLLRLPETKHLVIELKSHGIQPILVLAEEIKTHPESRNRISIIGFDLRQMAMAKKLLPDIPVLWLCGMTKDHGVVGWDDHARTPEEVIRSVQTHEIDGVDFHLGASATRPLTEKLIHLARQAGLLTYAWVVNRVAPARWLAARGVDGVTTDEPTLILGGLSEKEEPKSAKKRRSAS